MKISKEIKEQIKTYLKGEKKPLICIIGPTGSGKTDFGVEIAKEFSGEILNSDSRQIFKEIEQITGLDFEEFGKIPKHFFGFVDIFDNSYNSYKFSKLLRKKIGEILKEKKIPILVGGTGLFVSSIIEGFEFLENSTNEVLKEKIRQMDTEKLLDILDKKDPDILDKIHKNNRNYLERAVEVCMSGQKKSEGKKSDKLKFNALIFHKKIENREEFYEKINLRQEKLFENSLEKIGEIKKLCEEKKFEIKDFQSLKSIGIQEIFDFLNGEEKEICVEKMQKKARNYAKRQMTWWRRKENVFFI